ncbi:MAG: hypothetical protein JOZ83_00190 [Silvibacterium sp.]|nr:hypothetical protein [Silvibacterium sp.]
MCATIRASRAGNRVMASGNSWIDTHAQAASSPAGFDLRPLSTGEVLDRTFQLYRSRFALFAGLAVLPAAVSVVIQALRFWYSANQSVKIHAGANLVRLQVITISLTVVYWIITLLLYGITQAATTWAVSAVYLGEPATIKPAYRAALGHWFRYTLIVLRQIYGAFWLPIILLAAGFIVAAAMRASGAGIVIAGVLYLAAFVSFIYAIWAYIRVSLAIPAAVVESLKVNASIRRSKQLLTTRKVRVFLLLVLLFALYFVIGAIQMPLLVIAVRARGAEAFVTHAISLAIGFVAGTLVGPIGAIGVCLFYFDERVRREGFDIEWMMRRIAPAGEASPVSPVLEQGPSGA